MTGDDEDTNGPATPPTVFGGHIGDTVGSSTPWWPAPVRPSGGSPNVVVIVLDDVGFAQLGCYGSSIRTPHIDSLASGGLRYTNFHVTALCSTTRSCLLTGRNHHAVGVGFLADFDTGFPGYRGAVSPAATTIAEQLGAQGFGTYAAGKWHLTPPGHMTPAGPFHQWPTGRGFDRYYGFLWGEDDQYAPELWHDQHHVEPPDREGYHLSEDLVDRSIRFVSDHVSAAPDRPFLLYLAFGACHAPHQAPREYIDGYRGAFDHGWDEERLRTLDRQVDLGIVPADTQLPAHNPGVEPWDELPAEQQRLYARMQEVYAGFMEHTDDQIGRLTTFLAEHDLLQDTLVVLLSDNGASGEGGPHGSVNEYRYFLNLPDSLEETIAAADELGGPRAHNHYPMGWAQAGNTPLKFYKKHTFGGGVRAPLIMSWPARIADRGGLRTQFHHVIDVAPTLLDACGVRTPDVYRGVDQLPLHGTPMTYSFDDPTAASTRRQQYFETAGHRGLYRDGWKIVTNHDPATPFTDDRFELYHLPSDFSETRDLAETRPDTVRELVDAWWQDARQYGVLPLDDRMQDRVTARDPSTDRSAFRLLPGARLSNGPAGPNFAGRSFEIAAELSADPTGSERLEDGVLLAYGRRAAGFSFFIQDGRLVLDLNLAGRHHLVETEPLSAPAAVNLGARVLRREDDALLELTVDSRSVASATAPSGMPAGLGCLTTQCGHNSPSPVSDRYVPPFASGARLREVRLTFHGPEDASALWTAAVGSD